mgnify:CR=1 FL=1
MAIAVEDLLQLIQDAHPALHVVRTDAGVGIRALQAELAGLVSTVLRERPEALTYSEATVTITSAHFSAGWDFNAGVMPLHVQDVEAREVSGLWRPVERVGWDARYMPRRLPCVTVRRAVLWPLGTEQDYVGFDTWRVRFIGPVAALTLKGAGATITVLPDHATNALASMAAFRIAKRLAKNASPPIDDLSGLDDTRTSDFNTFMNTLGVDTQSEVWVKRDVLD